LNTDSHVVEPKARFSTLDDWLRWFETLHPKRIDFGLGRIRTVLESLGIAQPAYPVITVGGTNGKGSCVAMLEGIYRSAGFKVGAFTSPHLIRFNERIRFDGRNASDAELMELFARIDAALGAVTLSYFEFSAVAALLHFARNAVDVAVLEVGMGGRLDAVNVYDADAALIVSVALDHEDWLGPDREAIGWEKAGIMRPGRPAVVADPDPPASLRRAAEELGAIATFAGVDYDYSPADGRLEYRARDREPRSLPVPGFGGAIQMANVAACARVVDAMQASLPVPDAALEEGIRAARLDGRIDARRVDGVDWLFDVAHNPAAAALLGGALRRLPRARHTLAVFGAMLDKALAGVLEPFIAAVDDWFVAPVDSPRSAPGSELEKTLAALGAASITVFTEMSSACRAARAAARPGDRVLVFGSFYTVGPCLAALGLYSSVAGEE
jgi:dihydrofolate synthase/folylpolyglutamate synthase